MANEVKYRKLNISDKTHYHEIRIECLSEFPDNFGTLLEEELQSKSFKFDSIIEDENSDDFLMGAFIQEKLIGICGFIQQKRQKTKHIGEISGMYVKSQNGGTGIGAGLIKSAIQNAFKLPHLEQIILTVASKNTVALKLYHNIGFKEYGRMDNYFKHHDKYEAQVFMVLMKQQ